jgi:hypothetical protein
MKDWPDKLKLLSVLSTTSSLAKRSSREGWDAFEPDEVRNEIEQLIDALHSDSKRALPKNWDLLFAPTGSIQELSIANGWGSVFLKLAEEFDSLKYLLNGHRAEQDE